MPGGLIGIKARASRRALLAASLLRSRQIREWRVILWRWRDN
jgi:hypothetical protein